MNKPVDVLYDEYIESYDPRAMISKLKKNELIDLLLYAKYEFERVESIALLEEQRKVLLRQFMRMKVYLIIKEERCSISVLREEITNETISKRRRNF